MSESVTKRTGLQLWNILHERWYTEELSLTVSGGATPSRETEAIDVRGFTPLALTIDHNRTGSDSTDLDTFVYSSHDGVVFDTEPLVTESALGAAKVKTVTVTSGVCYVKLKVANEDAGNATKVKLTLTGIR